MNFEALISKRRYPVLHEDTVQGSLDMMVDMSIREMGKSMPGPSQVFFQRKCQRCDNGLHKPSIPSSCGTHHFPSFPKI